jgi:uncharacterized membrane protein YfcA
MDLLSALMLLGAGALGGVLAGLVGGASLVTFPALLAAGLPPVTAAASNLAAITPANLIAVFTDRSQLPPFDRGFAGLVLASIVGALIGAALLLLTPQRAFEVLVPLLLGFATVLFAYSARITKWLRERGLRRHGREPQLAVTSIPMLLPVAVYGGYFGAGVGVLLLAVLSVATAGDYRSANVIKNLVTGINTTAAVIYLAAFGLVSWAPTLVMMAGALVGGLMGGHLGRIAPPHIMRFVVVAMGVLLTVAYAWRYWF